MGKMRQVCVFLHLGMDLQFVWKGGRGDMREGDRGLKERKDNRKEKKQESERRGREGKGRGNGRSGD